MPKAKQKSDKGIGWFLAKWKIISVFNWDFYNITTIWGPTANIEIPIQFSESKFFFLPPELFANLDFDFQQLQ